MVENTERSLSHPDLGVPSRTAARLRDDFDGRGPNIRSESRMIRQVLQSAVSHVPWRMRRMIKHVPLVAPFQRWLIANVLGRAEFVHRFDAGGWHVFYAGVMALAGASKVFVFEPLPANCDRIRRLIELNPALPIELLEAA